MLEKWEIEQLRRLNIVYHQIGEFHALPFGKAKDTGLTELQFAQSVLGCSMYKTRKKVNEYLKILDKNCKYKD